MTTFLQPPSTLLMGPPGCGKTTVLATLAKAGLEVFVIVTEPNGVESLIDAWDRMGLPIDKLHWATVSPSPAGWKAMEEMGRMINSMSYKDLSETKQGIAKSEMKQFPKLLSLFQNFVDERTGESFGDVTTWDSTRALAVDSLSGLNLIVMQHTVGYKPSPHQGEWGIAMNSLEMLLLKLTADVKCFFILTAHIDKEPNELTGGTTIYASALGRKLAPKIPRFFSEVILARRSAEGFTWSTASNDADLKNRALPVSSKLVPDFTPIVDAYKRRVATSMKASVTPTTGDNPSKLPLAS
jgi:hypothetical protein